MLMPYYRKTMDAEAEIEAVRVAAAESLAEVQSLEATAGRNRAEAGAAAAEAAELQARATALEQAARQRLRPTPVVQEGPDLKRQAIEALDLVFAIDTTASMTPVIHDPRGVDAQHRPHSAAPRALRADRHLGLQGPRHSPFLR